METTLEQASKQDRLALRRTCGKLSSGTRVKLTNSNGVVHDVEARISIVKHKHDGNQHVEISRKKQWHHELVHTSDLVILRRKTRLSNF